MNTAESLLFLLFTSPPPTLSLSLFLSFERFKSPFYVSFNSSLSRLLQFYLTLCHRHTHSCKIMSHTHSLNIKNREFHASCSLFSSLLCYLQKQCPIKLPMIGFEPGSFVMESTVLPTLPQPMTKYLFHHPMIYQTTLSLSLYV